jgi:integrase
LRKPSGYVVLRPRIHQDGERYYGASVGIRRGRNRREQERNEREAWAQARASLDTLKAALGRGERPDPARARRSLGAQLDVWLKAKQGKVGANKWKSYESALRRHVQPYPIAHVPLGRLQGEDVDRWLADLRAAGASTAMARYAFDRVLECLRALLADVVMANLQTVVNGAADRRPRHRKQPTRPFDAAERGALLRHLAGGAAEEPYASLFAVALYAGLRFSEAAGLPWGEVHWTDRSLTVRWQLDRDTREPRQVKTEASVRTVPLSDDALAVLRARQQARRAAGKPTGPSDLVWTARPWGRQGERGVGYTQARRKFAAFCRAAGLGAVSRTHALRHTFGTTIARAGGRHAVISDLMGHADPAVTHVYTRHTVSDELRRAVEAADGIGIPFIPPGPDDGASGQNSN